MLIQVIQTQLLTKVIALDSMNSLFSKDCGKCVVEVCLNAILSSKHSGGNKPHKGKFP